MVIYKTKGGINMKRILVAYTTNAGTTADVAKVIGEELGREGAQVDVRRLEEVANLEAYSAVVVGAPLIVGWHPAAKGFVKKHRAALSRVPVAYFVTAMRLTDTGETTVEGVPVCVDPGVLTPPKNPARLGFKERYATLGNYLKPMLNSARGVRPVSVGFFGGVLALYTLKWWQAFFVMLVIQAPPGGSHNLPLIREWAAGLRAST
jgi:menaquinone-dependent protoporphyrinogen IX oxidase